MKLMFAQVAVNVPSVSGVYSYHIPDALAGSLGPGSLVTVSFGAQTVQGVVLALAEASPVAATKPILELLDPLPVLTAPQLELARYLAESTLSPLASTVGLMLPPGLSQQADTRAFRPRACTLTPVQPEPPQPRMEADSTERAP